ncbi:MAG TPA: glycoside hydrolase family 3 C-terminal domain-containing protein [Pyrinomonadaceae bacterium]
MRHHRRAVACVLLLLCVSPLPAPARSRAGGRASPPPYKDPRLPVERRADDLVSRMTLEEKISQMMNAAPAIERLGVPAHDWWNEGLHGVARAGYATVFPQAVGLAATWNPELIERVADVVSTEARAKHHEAARRGERGRYRGLTFWSPNINIFRDPRWGRGQETFGEDPYLTSRIGVAYVRGLQGDDPRYLKVASTPKHYAVHSGPEPERHGFDARASERDLRETYLPAFRAAVVEGRAEGVMCAYNRTNGEPACANKKLFDILRREWRFGGHVVSDCGAVEDIWKHHRFAESEAEAAALAVKSGTDLTCGGEYRSLIQAVKDGLITEAEIDVAVKRLMRTRFRLGVFDPPGLVRYARTPFSANDSPAHRALSLAAARESIVLLKNEGNALPLPKSVKTLAVIGPNADAAGVLLGNYNGRPSKSVTPLQGIRAKLPRATQIIHAPGSTLAGEELTAVPDSALTTGGPGTRAGLRAEFFDNKELRGRPVVKRVDGRVDFDWETGRPAPQVGDDNFSARWTGRLVVPESGEYRLGAVADDGVRVYLDGRLLIDAWTDGARWSPPKTILKDVRLEAGRGYDVRFEYYDGAGPAVARLVWSFPRFAERLRAEAVEAARRADVAVVVLGLSPSLEGEEMPVKVEGFRGGDRTSLDLPKVQDDLLRAVHAAGKPVVLVMLSGSAVAVNWAAEHVPAIVEAWYPGQEGGAALADVLFGDYNPAGRLPVTFYRSAEQLPPFDDYRMRGRTYRYFEGDALYPFGHGLSYTIFRYSNPTVAPARVGRGERATVTVTVRNAGRRAGDEVVQLYVTRPGEAGARPLKELKDFRRVTLAPGESRRVEFVLTPDKLSAVDESGRGAVLPGGYEITVGPSSAGGRKTRLEVVGR